MPPNHSPTGQSAFAFLLDKPAGWLAGWLLGVDPLATCFVGLAGRWAARPSIELGHQSCRLGLYYLVTSFFFFIIIFFFFFFLSSFFQFIYFKEGINLKTANIECLLQLLPLFQCNKSSLKRMSVIRLSLFDCPPLSCSSFHSLLLKIVSLSLLLLY